ncbi:hypothetical protein GCM10011339_21260 [Echinicola rosea]|uniref:N-sulphoglucosamine sulphohydrolase C-terminal domain-containing protein n=1 Tax=Echinicola rosea TaxID=1807691 RepID=A0ABQ1V1D5_9BACT|nr:hypothetical protein GCM10011339_21260 [Echinicola rosea]
MDKHWGNFKKSVFIHDQDWKLYQSGEIYHLKNDPSEKHTVKLDELDGDDHERIYKLNKALNQFIKQGHK